MSSASSSRSFFAGGVSLPSKWGKKAKKGRVPKQKAMAPRLEMHRTAVQAATQNSLLKGFLELGPLSGLDTASHLEAMASNLKVIAEEMKGEGAAGEASKEAAKCIETLRTTVLPFVARGALCNERMRTAVEQASELLEAHAAEELSRDGVSISALMRDWRVIYESFLEQMREEAAVNTWTDNGEDPRIMDEFEALRASKEAEEGLSGGVSFPPSSFRTVSLALAELCSSLSGMAVRAMLVTFSRLVRVASLVAELGIMRRGLGELSSRDRGLVWLLFDAANTANASIRYTVCVFIKVLGVRDGIAAELAELSGRKSITEETIASVVGKHYVELFEDSHLHQFFYPFLLEVEHVLGRECTDANIKDHDRFNPAAGRCVRQVKEWGGFAAAIRTVLDAHVRSRIALFGDLRGADHGRYPPDFPPLEQARYPPRHAWVIAENSVLLSMMNLVLRGSDLPVLVDTIDAAAGSIPTGARARSAACSDGRRHGPGPGPGPGPDGDGDGDGEDGMDAIDRLIVAARRSTGPASAPKAPGPRPAEGACAQSSMGSARRFHVAPHAPLPRYDDMERLRATWEAVRLMSRHKSASPSTFLETLSFVAQLSLHHPVAADGGVSALMREFKDGAHEADPEYNLVRRPEYIPSRDLASAVGLLDSLCGAREGVETWSNKIIIRFTSDAREFAAMLSQVRSVVQSSAERERGEEDDEAGEGRHSGRSLAHNLTSMGFYPVGATSEGVAEGSILSGEEVERVRGNVIAAFRKAASYYLGARSSALRGEVSEHVSKCMSHGVGIYAWKVLSGADAAIVEKLFRTEVHMVEAFSRSTVEKYEKDVEKGRRRRLSIQQVIGDEHDPTIAAYDSLSKWAVASSYMSTITNPTFFTDASFSAFDPQGVDEPPNPGESGEYIMSSILSMIREGQRACGTDDSGTGAGAGAGRRRVSHRAHTPRAPHVSSYDADSGRAADSLSPDYVSRYFFRGKVPREVIFAGVFAEEIINSGILGARFKDSMSLPAHFGVSSIRPLVGTRSSEMCDWLVHQVVGSVSSGSNLVQKAIHAGVCSRMNKESKVLEAEEEEEDVWGEDGEGGTAESGEQRMVPSGGLELDAHGDSDDAE